VVGYPEPLWETPLSPVALSPEYNGMLADKSLDVRVWAGGTDDNTIEVEMPLVKLFFPESRALALRAAPDPSAMELGEALLGLLSGKRALLLASTDLTHYGEAYGFAPAGPGQAGLEYRERNDRAFIDAALALDSGSILELGNNHRAACSAGAAAAVSRIASELGLKGSLIDYYSSSDVQGGGGGGLSVGYAGIIYSG
jgi:AmmeMemoRadiSam system protein B